MDDLVQFLRARYDEEHLLAIEAGDGSPAQWTYAPELTWNGPEGPREAVVDFQGSAMGYVAVVDPVHGEHGTWQARHIARHDPARVLAEVDAKRRILDSYLPDATSVDEQINEEWRAGSALADDLLHLLALPYVDHTDYQDDWRP